MYFEPFRFELCTAFGALSLLLFDKIQANTSTKINSKVPVTVSKTVDAASTLIATPLPPENLFRHA